MTDQSLDQKVVWVTGASSGIGREAVRLYAESGGFEI